MARTPWIGGLAVVAAAALAMLVCSSCGGRETAIQRVTRLRNAHRVQPGGFQPRRRADGAGELVISMLVVNTGREVLPRLTILVHVQDAAGADRAAARASLDTSALIPGVAQQLSAVVPGLEVREGERVLVELEREPGAQARAEMPEYAQAAGTSR